MAKGRDRILSDRSRTDILPRCRWRCQTTNVNYAVSGRERGIQKLVAHYSQQSGLTKKASPHTFRHTFATQKAKSGVSPYKLKDWLGHANLNTTQIYVHMGEENTHRLMEQTSL